MNIISNQFLKENDEKLKTINENQNRPKTVIRGPDGKIAGVQ